jgi:hypothetical protein
VLHLLCIGTGGEINRVRSMNMERRLQENSQIQALPMNGVTYDYPTTQVHPYHVLEAPPTEHNSLLNYTTMQPAGSVREGAITPMGHSSHTIRSIYDDDVTSGEHRDPEYDAPNLVDDHTHNNLFSCSLFSLHSRHVQYTTHHSIMFLRLQDRSTDNR